jgi:type IV pilus assembly protein PilY1
MNGGWHTVLVGTLGAGGRGVFALDVTEPGAFDQGDVLWEFTAAQDTDLGVSIPQATIGRMYDGSWAAIVANGYNSGGGRAVLFILDLATGSIIRKIDTGVGGDNGLSSPLPADVDGDRITDYIYAGDLKGNLWKFDVTAANPSLWDAAFGIPGSPQPLFTACTQSPCTDANRQPITARPEVGLNPGGGVIVYFGTGRYFALGDNSTGGPLSSFYAIIDANDKGAPDPQPPTGGRDALLAQEVISEQTLTLGGVAQPVRITTNHAIGGGHEGWYLDLPASGERQVSTPILRGGRIIFTTLIPDTDPCSAGGTSWLMEMDALTGSRLAYSPFDLNGDREFDSGDFAVVTVDGQVIAVPVTGRMSLEGIIKTPGIVSGDRIEFKYASGTSGGIDRTVENSGSLRGRQSWRDVQ